MFRGWRDYAQKPKMWSAVKRKIRSNAMAFDILGDFVRSAVDQVQKHLVNQHRLAYFGKSIDKVGYLHKGGYIDTYFLRGCPSSFSGQKTCLHIESVHLMS